MSAADDNGGTQGVRGGLFPAYASGSELKTPSSLFPAYKAHSTGKSSEDKCHDGALDWLENQSFGKDTAASLKRIQEEAEDRKTKLRISGDELSSDDVTDKDNKEQKRKFESEDDEARQSKKKKKKKHKKHKKRSHKEDSDESETLKEKQTFFKPEQGKIFVEDVSWLTAGDAYRVDRAADPNNLTYGSLYKLHIAKYHRLGSCCVGLGEGQTLSWLVRSSKTSKKQRSREERYFAKENVKVLRTSEAVPCTGVMSASGSDGLVHVPQTKDSDFYPLENVNTQEFYKILDMSKSVNPLGVYDSSTCSYLQGKSTEKMADVKAVENPTVLPSEVSSANKTAVFNKALREDPHDIMLWLEFVKFQETNSLLTAGSIAGSEMDKLRSSSAHIAEKKLAILHKALQSNPASIELKMAELELSREILEPQEIGKQWDQLLFVHPGNITLWLHYILFVQSNLSQFTVAKTVKCYHRCLAKLSSVMSEDVHLVDKDRPMEEDLLIIFYQYCCFLKQTGHTEKAVASLQALVEFNLFSPELVKGIPHTEKVTVFESFWDSGVSRFGEGGAKGWVHWVQNRDALPDMTSSQVESEEAEEAILAKEQPVWKTWLEMETHRESVHWLPWRPDLSENQTEEDCEDPDRLVLVDDITPALFTFNQKELHFDLILVFLHFIGVEVKCFHSSKLLDHLEKSQLFLQNVNDASSSSTENIGFCWNNSLFADSLRNFVCNIVKQSMAFASGVHKTKLSLLQLEFEVQVAKVTCDQKLDKTKCKELRKLAKGCLKEEQNRNNLQLWTWYARLERSLGKVDESIRVLETVLSMQPGNELSQDRGYSEKMGLYDLYLTYIQIQFGIPECLEFTLGKRRPAPSPEAIQCVVNTVECLAEEGKFSKPEIMSKKPSPISVLKTKRKLSDLQKKVMENLMDNHRVEAVDQQTTEYLVLTSCMAMYEYCTSTFDAVTKYYSGLVSECDRTIASSSLEEQKVLVEVKRKLYIDWLKMVIFHQTTSVCPLSRLQAVLDSALKNFPEDRQFLQLFVAVETQSFITGRLRRFFDRAVRESSTPYPAVFYCLAEIKRHLALLKSKRESSDSPVRGETGILHRLRSLLERVLINLNSQNCVLLWRLYMHIEVQFGESSRAKGLFYRALQKCPWSKTLYKDAVSLFPEQLQELVDLMLEKEIRVQIPVEEIHILRGTSEEVASENGALEGELYTKLVKDIHDES